MGGIFFEKNMRIIRGVVEQSSVQALGANFSPCLAKVGRAHSERKTSDDYSDGRGSLLDRNNNLTVTFGYTLEEKSGCDSSRQGVRHGLPVPKTLRGVHWGCSPNVCDPVIAMHNGVVLSR